MSEKLFLPALQGALGDWTYYVALVELSDLVERVGYARQLQSNPRLSELIQRRLDEDKRAEEISDYLVSNDARFFNAIVVGVLGGAPAWSPFSLSSSLPNHDLGNVVERDQDLVGYLELRGDESLFALDGQHRLAGIKRALLRDPKLAHEKLSVIFVPHQATPQGVQRTRGLFISLNKKAVPVQRRDIIALDEVDLPAIITRQLIDDHPWFCRGQIDFDTFTNSLPASSSSWTTIGNFYDINAAVIAQMVEGRDDQELDNATKNRLPEERIQFYKDGVVDFYQRLSRVEPLLKNVFDATDGEAVAKSAKSAEDPRLLFRPVGLKIFCKVAAEFRKTKTLSQTFKQLGRIPLRMDERPFAGTIWNEERGTIRLQGESLATRLLFYMLGLSPSDEKLRNSYADWFGLERGKTRLPRRLPEV